MKKILILSLSIFFAQINSANHDLGIPCEYWQGKSISCANASPRACGGGISDPKYNLNLCEQYNKELKQGYPNSNCVCNPSTSPNVSGNTWQVIN